LAAFAETLSPFMTLKLPHASSDADGFDEYSLEIRLSINDFSELVMV